VSHYSIKEIEQLSDIKAHTLRIWEHQYIFIKPKKTNTNILQIGFERTMLSLIYPFFQKIDLLWQTGAISPGQEYFISNLVRQKNYCGH